MSLKSRVIDTCFGLTRPSSGSAADSVGERFPEDGFVRPKQAVRQFQLENSCLKMAL
jgi:hypothetical protein